MTVEISTAYGISEAYRRGQVSPVEIVSQVVDGAEISQPVINAFQMLDCDYAVEQAKQSEERWRVGEAKSDIDGLPIAIKDLNLTAGWPTLSGSRTVDPKQSWVVDSPCVARLREAGAVLFGKTTTPEFGWKGLTDSPLSGYTRNPWDLNRSCGGSSGGAAASVAAGICPVNHASDGGGSIRIPASYCGLFGFKPTFGRIASYPRKGAFATLASEGPITRTVRDAVMLLQVFSGPDDRDAFALPVSDLDYMMSLNDGVKDLKIALCNSLGDVTPQNDIAQRTRAAAVIFELLGARVTEVDSIFESLRPIFERYWLAMLWHRVSDVPDSKRELLDRDLLRVSKAGMTVSLSEFSVAMTARAELISRMNRFYRYYDLLLTPTMPTDPPLVGTPYHTKDFDRWEHAVPYTVPFNLTGQPAASIACGLSDLGLPVGLQIVGRLYDDRRVLSAASAFEGVSPPLELPKLKR